MRNRRAWSVLVERAKPMKRCSVRRRKR